MITHGFQQPRRDERNHGTSTNRGRVKRGDGILCHCPHAGMILLANTTRNGEAYAVLQVFSESLQADGRNCHFQVTCSKKQ